MKQGFQKKGDDILSHNDAVPSAQAGLTSLFGMGRGEPRRNNHLKAIRCKQLPIINYQLQIINYQSDNILTYWDKETNKLYSRKFPPPVFWTGGKGCA